MCMVLKHIDTTYVYCGYVWNKSVYHCCCMVYGYGMQLWYVHWFVFWFVICVAWVYYDITAPS